MPPGRRKSTQPTTSQRTLAFGPHPNKVTKPNQPPPTTFKKASPLLAQNRLLTPSPPPPALEEIKSPEANLTIREPKPKAITKSESEERAAGLGEGAVRNYWRRQETERKAPRGRIFLLRDSDFLSHRGHMLTICHAGGGEIVHQQDISMHEKILRHFDLSSQYGVSIFLAFPCPLCPPKIRI